MSLDESRILVQFDRKHRCHKQLKSFFRTHRREVTAMFRAARLTLQESCE